MAFHLLRGDAPLLVSLPHVGTTLAAATAERLTAPARRLPDTDWLLVELYDFLPELGVTRLHAEHPRQLIDLNRPPDDAPLYATTTTGLVPAELFDGSPAWKPGHEPDAAERAVLLERYWRPYHDALSRERTRLRNRYGEMLLLDLHSIRSQVPRLFEGTLPDFNLGTNQGRACPPSLTEALESALAPAPYTQVTDARFRGGYITRRYGEPAKGQHALQLELSQATYMHEGDTPVGAASARIDDARASQVRPWLRAFVEAALAWITARVAGPR